MYLCTSQRALATEAAAANKAAAEGKTIDKTACNSTTDIRGSSSTTAALAYNAMKYGLDDYLQIQEQVCVCVIRLPRRISLPEHS